MSITGAYTWEDISSLGMEAYFQPIYNVEKHRITGLEALFRVRDGRIPRPGEPCAGGRGRRMGA